MLCLRGRTSHSWWYLRQHRQVHHQRGCLITCIATMSLEWVVVVTLSHGTNHDPEENGGRRGCGLKSTDRCEADMLLLTASAITSHFTQRASVRELWSDWWPGSDFTVLCHRPVIVQIILFTVVALDSTGRRNQIASRDFYINQNVFK